MTSVKFSGFFYPHQYQIHVTSLPLVRNWPTPSSLNKDIICERPLGLIFETILFLVACIQRDAASGIGSVLGIVAAGLLLWGTE